MTRASSGASEGALARAAPAVGGDEHQTYTLERAAQRLGKSDGALERAVRAAHPDAELRAEGARVASERIVRDGERLCSKAVTHLDSKDPDVQRAARLAGLTPELVGGTVEVLRRLEGMASRSHATQQSSRATRRSVATTREAALASGRQLKTSVLARLQRITGLDAAVKAAVEQAVQSPATPSELAAQLTSLAEVVERCLAHADDHVRVLARSRGLEAADAAELQQHADAIAQAEQERAVGTAGQAEEQLAVLDVLDGLCLLLVEDVLRALRLMATHTALVRRPALVGLSTYFGARKRPGKPDATDDEASPVG